MISGKLGYMETEAMDVTDDELILALNRAANRLSLRSDENRIMTKLLDNPALRCPEAKKVFVVKWNFYDFQRAEVFSTEKSAIDFIDAHSEQCWLFPCVLDSCVS